MHPRLWPQKSNPKIVQKSRTNREPYCTVDNTVVIWAAFRRAQLEGIVPNPDNFKSFFKAATATAGSPGLDPYSWQIELASEQITSRLINVPTGCGKTAGVNPGLGSLARWRRRDGFDGTDRRRASSFKCAQFERLRRGIRTVTSFLLFLNTASEIEVELWHAVMVASLRDRLRAPEDFRDESRSRPH